MPNIVPTPTDAIPTPRTVRVAVDQIAALSAEIAERNAEKTRLIDALKLYGEGTYEGSEHYVLVKISERSTLDLKAVRKKLTRQFIAAHTRVTEVVSATLRGYNNAVKREAA